ncbi:MAG: thioredoxin family protein [Anaerolineales bacterium]|nr:thioredoxin family protein [Anaerolineales bacterium]
METLLIRLGLAAGIAIFGWLLYVGWRRMQLARLRAPKLGLEGWHGDGPAILYFTTPDCVPCKTQQQPELRKLAEQLAEQREYTLQVIQIDATQQPKLADYWGVLSVPTTFVINSRGQARAMNPGVASAEKLLSQLQQAEQPDAPTPDSAQSQAKFVKYQGRIE